MAVGLLLLVQVAPRFLGPFAWTLADRMDQRCLMAWCDFSDIPSIADVLSVSAVTDIEQYCFRENKMNDLCLWNMNNCLNFLQQRLDLYQTFLLLLRKRQR